jgi:hypothetical protein
MSHRVVEAELHHFGGAGAEVVMRCGSGRNPHAQLKKIVTIRIVWNQKLKYSCNLDTNFFVRFKLLCMAWYIVRKDPEPH